MTSLVTAEVTAKWPETSTERINRLEQRVNEMEGAINRLDRESVERLAALARIDESLRTLANAVEAIRAWKDRKEAQEGEL